jgi:hypothetical protein
MPRAVALRHLAPVALLLATSGCYAYTRVPPEAVGPGRALRLTLTDVGSAELWRELGPRASAVDALIAARDSTAFRVAVLQVVRSSGVEERWAGEEVRLPQPAIAVAETRRFSTVRTAALAGGMAAAAWLLARVIEQRADIVARGGRPGGGTTR